MVAFRPVLSYHFFESLLRLAISIAAINPSMRPISIPMVTFLISRPITIPVTMATIKAISLRFSMLYLSFVLIKCNDISQQTISSWNACGQFTKKHQSGISKITFPVRPYDQTSILIRFTSIVHGKNSLISRIDMLCKINSSFLNPSIKIFAANLIWKIQHTMVWQKKIYSVLSSSVTRPLEIPKGIRADIG